MTGPLAPDDPDRDAGDAEEDGDGHAEPDDEAEVGDDHTDTVSGEVSRLAHPSSTAAPLHVLPGTELSSVERLRLSAAPPLVLGTVGTAGGPGGPGAPPSVHHTQLVTLPDLLALSPALSPQAGGGGVVADPLPPPLSRPAS